MKTVLVLTDFSRHANHAAETALFLAEKMQLNILLFNVYFSLPVIPTSESDAWSKSYEIFKKESEVALDSETTRLTEIFNQSKPGEQMPIIQYLTAFGDLGDHIYKIIDERNIEFVAMGARKEQNAYIFGDDINNVLKKSKKPVLIVNDSLNYKQTKNVVLTTDLAFSDLKTVECLSKLSGLFQFEVHVASVSPNADELKKSEKVNRFSERINRLNPANLDFQILTGDNVIEELIAFNAKIGADLLAIVHKRRSFLWNIFHESVSKKFIATSKISLLILPEQ